MSSEMSIAGGPYSQENIGGILKCRARVITENYRFSEWSEWSDAITLTSPLSKTYIYPNPVKSGNLTFTNLSNDALKIKIYTITGELVRTIYKDNSGTEAVWDIKNDSRREVASGAYFYRIESGDYHKKGKIAVIR
jgi:flagellar hook assembly protein FlgD